MGESLDSENNLAMERETEDTSTGGCLFWGDPYLAIPKDYIYLQKLEKQSY